MTHQTFQIELQDGSTINGLTWQEANDLFFAKTNRGEIRSVRPWPVKEYVAPGQAK